MATYHTNTVVVANPTVTVSRSMSVEMDVTVIKILVVIPSMLVDVLVPPSAPTKPMPALLVPSSAFLPLPSVGAGAGCEVVVEWRVTGITTKGSSSVAEEAGAGKKPTGVVEVGVGVVGPGWCSVVIVDVDVDSVGICSGSGAFVLVDWAVELSSVVGLFSGSDDLVLVVCVVELSADGVTVL